MAKQARVGIDFGNLHKPLAESVARTADRVDMEDLVPRKDKLEPYMIRVPGRNMDAARRVAERLGDGVTLQDVLRRSIEIGLQQLKEKAGMQ